MQCSDSTHSLLYLPTFLEVIFLDYTDFLYKNKSFLDFFYSMKKPPARTASGGFFLTDRDSLSSQLWVVSISIAISERKQVQALQFTIPTFHRKPATSYRTPLRMNPVQELYQEQYNDFLLKNKGFLGKRYILLDQGSDTCTQVSNPLFSVSYTGLLYEKYTKNQEKN
jgi:hypothetical protein